MNNTRFPARRRTWESIEQEMIDTRSADLPWWGERSFKPAYFAGEDVLEVANQAYQMYITDNALYGKSAFPSLQRYETEVIEMILDLLHGPFGAGGSVTTGGTESNFMAVKAARDWAREHLPEATRPNMLVPRTAHPSFDKAAHMLGVDIIRMARSADFRADVASMRDAVTEHTIMLVGSAPPYPYGETDPIPELSELAVEHGRWLHVDGCLGGFILPFAREFDASIPDFDFALPGVMSMSADLHKYGYAAKGISALLLRDSELEQFHRSTFDDWPSGLYSTTGVSGSRSGGALASAWAVMSYLGREGYREVVKAHLDIRNAFFTGIRAVDGLEVWANPHAYNFAFGSRELDTFAIADGMLDHGWGVGRADEPPSIQLMLNRSHEHIVPTFQEELGEVVAGVRDGRIKARGEQAIYAV